MLNVSIEAIIALCCLSIVWCVPPAVPKVQKEPPAKEEFSMQINEQGWKFTEKVSFDMKKETIIHHVPAHRTLSESYAMIEFSSNLTVTRHPGELKCFIQPKSPEVESFDALKYGMDTVSSGQYQMTPGVKVIKNVLRVTGLTDLTKLSSDVLNFCRGMDIYDVDYEPQDAPLRHKRSGGTTPPKWTTPSCYKMNVLKDNWKKCSRSQRVMLCGYLTHQCYYFITCTSPPQYLRSGQCTETHRTDDFACCNPWCN